MTARVSTERGLEGVASVTEPHSGPPVPRKAPAATQRPNDCILVQRKVPPMATDTTTASIEDFVWKPEYDEWLTKVETARATLADVVNAGRPLADDAEYADRLRELSDLVAIGDLLSFALNGLRDLSADA